METTTATFPLGRVIEFAEFELNYSTKAEAAAVKDLVSACKDVAEGDSSPYMVGLLQTYTQRLAEARGRLKTAHEVVKHLKAVQA